MIYVFWKIILFTAISNVCVSVSSVEEPLIHVEHGAVRGSSHLLSLKNRTIYSFEGIPYARPPVGKYRFREPQTLKPWRGIWDGRQQGCVCLQYDHMVYLLPLSLSIVGDEDCLFVNVYTPKLPNNTDVRNSCDDSGSTKLMDVIVYIHGGGFTSGSGNLYMPRYLLDRDVVFVTLNYRLGPFGFLSTEDEIIPGNNGLKDQQFALSWIQRNIRVFGGNPGSVTISGMSAGGVSVQHHYFSPRSVGLFHRGISMSGSGLMRFSQVVENAREKADTIAVALGCPTKSSFELMECLQNRPARRIVRLVKELFMKWHYNPMAPFGPVIETAGSQPFLTAHPMDLLLEGKVQDLPWIISITSEEGLYPTSNYVANAGILKELDERWLELAPIVLLLNASFPASSHKEVAEKIKKEYLGDKPISRATNRQLTHIFSDRIYVVNIEKAARLQAAVKISPVFFYKFSYRGKHSYSELMSGGSTEDFGVSHGDDTMYVIDVFYGNPEETNEDKAMIERMVDFWTSFAKTGVPSSDGVTWTPIVPNKPEIDYLQINSSSVMYMAASEDLGRRRFWDTLISNVTSVAAEQQ